MNPTSTAMRFAAVRVLLCAMVAQAHAATITVTNTNDSGPGSLRQALTIANDGDTISFAVTGTIRLTSGGLLIAKNLTISGPGADQLSIDGNQTAFQCVFGRAPGKTVAISGLTITHGDAGICNGGGTLTVSNCVVSGNHPGVVNESHHGPAITNVDSMLTRNSGGQRPDGGGGNGSLTITNAIVRDNSGPGLANSTTSGAAIATILNSTLSGNYADPSSGSGGAINTSGFEGYAEVTVSNSTISGNSAPQGGGGGIASDYSAVTVVNSTISGNSAYSGGGIAGNVTGVTIVNSTVSGNSAESGGGGISMSSGYLYPASLVIANSTFSGNSADSGGGIYNGGQLGAVQIYSTILNAGASGQNIFNNGGTVTSHGYNISSDNGGGYLTGTGDQINTNPLLVLCKTTADRRSHTCYCPVAWRLTRAIQILLRRLSVTSAARASIACLVVASMSVQSKYNRSRGAQLQDRARRPINPSKPDATTG